MNREENIDKLKDSASSWDVLVIGGGATGLGIAVDSASRGFKTLLLEQHDFAKGTSSRSTKLIHGGLRYLKQGNLKLVKESLQERGILCKNAPHIVHPLPFLIPRYKWWEAPLYALGLKTYDLLAGTSPFSSSSSLSRKESLDCIPTLNPYRLHGSSLYYDGQFDDARLAITLANTATDLGATVINYIKVSSFLKKKGKCIGVKAIDEESKKTYLLYAKVIINATGIFSDGIREKDDPSISPLLTPSQGIHLVLPKDFLPSDHALLIPSTKDNRVLFLVPWHDKVLLGTTDTPMQTTKIPLEPKAKQQEISFLLKSVGPYLTKKPKKSDILSVFTGIRPLIHSSHKAKTSSLDRSHKILISTSGLITILGGKWTTYRKMAEDAVDKAIEVGNLLKRPCITKDLPLHGFIKDSLYKDPWSIYGSDQFLLQSMSQKDPLLAEQIHPRLPYQQIEALFAIRNEMARSVEDILARRSRSLFLDANASIEAAPIIAKIFAKELGKDASWQKKQIKDFTKLAKNYLP